MRPANDIYEVISVADIIVPKGRRALRNVDELAQSIDSVGLINPITVTVQKVLVAGLHRLEACKKLGHETIVAHVVTLDDVDRELVEIDENLVRVDLTVLERGEHLKRQKEHYEAKYPETKKGGSYGNQHLGGRPRLSETISFSQDAGAKVSRSGRSVQQEVQIASRLVPDVKDALRDTPLANNKVDLLKLARLEPAEQRHVVETIAAGGAPNVQAALFADAKARVAAQASLAPHRAQIASTSARQFLESLAPASADLLLTDPPYMTDVKDIGAFAAEWVPLALSRLKPTGRAYVCTGAYPAELHAYLSVLLAQSTFTVANVLVWTYRNTLGPAPKQDYKLNWQAIFYLRGLEAGALECPLMTEQFAVQDVNAPDGRLGNRYHAWQKPDELAERLVRHSTSAGDLVIDPFAGTGTFLLAAARLGRHALGSDISDENLAIAVERGCLRAA